MSLTEQELISATEAIQTSVEQTEMLIERLAVLEDSMADKGWNRVGGLSERDFSRQGLRDISKMVRIYWLKNPLIKRAVTVQNIYVWGQGCTLRAVHPDVDAAVQQVLKDPSNRRVFGDTEAWMRLEAELQLFANLFFVFFINPSTGRVKVRTIAFDEIAEVITDPDDSQTPWYYLRVWTSSTGNPTTGYTKTETHKAYYPDWRYNPAGGHPEHIMGIPVKQSPIYHVAVNRLNDMKFGVSELYAACDWAQAYKSYLEKWVTIMDMLSKFAMQLTGNNKKAVTGAVSKLQSILPTLQQSLAESRESTGPQTGGIFATTSGNKLEPIKTSGITASMDDARRLMLMVCSSVGINEPYLTGDPSTGNLATAKSMERPMELQFTARQALWQSVFGNILSFVIDMAAAAPNGRLSTGATIEIDDDGDRIITLGNDPETKEPMNRNVEIIFPPILQHDLLEQVDAIVHAGTAKGWALAGTMPVKYISTLLLDALGEKDSAALVEEWFPAEGEKPTDSEAELARVLGKLESYLQEAAA